MFELVGACWFLKSNIYLAYEYTGFPKNVRRLSGYCEGATGAKFPAFRFVNRRESNLESGTKLEYIWQVTADLWSEKIKITGCLESR